MKKMLYILIAMAACVAAALPALAISGMVVNKQGKPVPNAQVQFRVNYDTSYAVTTDTGGAFSYTPPDGKDAGCHIEVVAKGYGYFIGLEQYTLLQKEPVKLTVSSEKKLSGKLVDEKGRPVSGAKVALERIQSSNSAGGSFWMEGRQMQEGQAWSGGVIQEVTTASNGAFAIDHIPAGLKGVFGVIEATAKGRALVAHRLSDEDMNGAVEITLPLECKLQGTVKAPDGSAVTGGVRLAIPGTSFSFNGRSATVGKDGTYSVAKLPPGGYLLIIEKDYNTNAPTGAKESWTMPALPLELVSGKTQTLDINLVEGVLIKGKLVDKTTGKDIKTAELFAYHAGRPEGTTPEFLTENRGLKDGEFSCYVPPGEVDISPQRVGEVHFFREENRPHLTFTAVAGQPQTNLVFKIDPSEGETYGEYRAPKPVPSDLVLNEGTYGLSWDPKLICRYVRGKAFQGDDAKRKILKLPKLASKNALICAQQLDGDSDDGYLVYAVDESRGTGKGFDTIYADLDRNRNLADDKPISIRKPSDSAPGQSAWMTIPSHQGPLKGVHLDNPLKIRFSAYSYSGAVNMRVERMGGWRGKIDTNKGKIDCAAIDEDTNGVYGDMARDTIYADINLSGRISMEPAVEMPHALPIQQATMVADKLYSIKLSPAGNELTITNYSGPTGRLVASAEKMKGLGASISRVWLMGKHGYYAVNHYDGKPLVLPAGEYKFQRCQVSIPQTTGKQLDFDCQPDLTVNVKAGKQTTAALGGKLTVRGIEPDKKVVYLNSGNSSRAGWYMDLGDNITVARIGGTGDYYSYSPNAKLIDKSGHVVAASRANYT
jgi:hypothetical protein